MEGGTRDCVASYFLFVGRSIYVSHRIRPTDYWSRLDSEQHMWQEGTIRTMQFHTSVASDDHNHDDRDVDDIGVADVKNNAA